MTDSPPPDSSGNGENSADLLATYRQKRSPDRTPEPFGASMPAPVIGRLFVVHKHAARRLHFDLRLEMDGVLRSWAVPKGPSYDMNDKRLAVKVEDHPLEYGDFEGVIPAGNYGAGGVIVWDRGEWVPLEDWREGIAKGKLLFELKGYKLHGKWTLVKIKSSEKDWLLIKERDSFVKSPGDVFPEESVLSGLTVDEVKAGVTKENALRRAVEEAGAVKSRVDPAKVQAMLAEPRDDAFTRDGWIFELKLDGYRLIASKTNNEVTLVTRKGNDYTDVFPEIARAVKALPVDEFIIDGEVVVLDPQGLPKFSLLQQRGALHSPIEIKKMAVELPSTFFAFDMMAFEDLDLRPLPLVRRKALLSQVVPKLGPVRYLEHIEKEGDAFLASVTKMGLEGIIAKKADSPYRAGRTDKWLKIKAEQTSDFVIVGFTRPEGSRSHFGALQLADYVNGELVYAGRVGTGFSDALLNAIGEMLAPIVRETPPCVGPVFEGESEPRAVIPEIKTTTWVEPVNVVEVRFREWTPDGLLRHAALLHMRPDKPPRECVREAGPGSGVLGPVPDVEMPSSEVELAGSEVQGPRSGTLDQGPRTSAIAEPTPAPRTAPAKSFNFSNLNKIYWPAEKYTKGDMIEYYRAVSRWLLPYLRNRPLVMTRYPDGIDGKMFYQKDAPEFAPDWIRTVGVWSEDSQREIRYFVVDDEESLLYVANLGTIPVHIWASSVGSLELCDWCVIDLDPKDAPFKDVITCAQVLHKICESAGLAHYVKTTGKTGLHIMIPLGAQCTYEQSRQLGELLARLVLRETADIATITRHVTKRGTKVYLDYLQNRHGQTIVAPFSVRPLPGATVSMPLEWSEVDTGLDPKDYTIKNAVERMERLGADPVRPVLEEKPDLGGVLGRLAGGLAT